MPRLRIDDLLEMHYRIDDYTDPWRKAETILLLHGNAESGAVWFGWVPHLARHLRVVRPDMRGFGESTPMPEGFPWSLKVITDDLAFLMKSLDIGSCHVVGAKLGGTVARHFAARFPAQVLSLTVAGTPAPRFPDTALVQELVRECKVEGVEHWVRRTMGGRLGDRFPAEGLEWWSRLMARTPANSAIGFTANILTSDITADLSRIACPTLVITTEGSGLGSVEETRQWQQLIPDSRLLVLPGNSYHVAASDPDLCAGATLEFIRSCRQGRTEMTI